MAVNFNQYQPVTNARTSANDGIDVAELFVRFYVSLKDDSPAALDTNTGYPIFIVWDAITTEFMLLDFLTDGAGAIDRLLALDTAGTGSFVTTAFTPSTTPQYVEVHWLRHATTGGIQGRLDGSAWDNDDLDHDSDTGMVDLGTVHRLGAVIGGPTLFPDATDEWWFDDVKIDTNDWVGAFSIAHLRAHGL